MVALVASRDIFIIKTHRLQVEFYPKQALPLYDRAQPHGVPLRAFARFSGIVLVNYVISCIAII